jgi:hypothetical protein
MCFGSFIGMSNHEQNEVLGSLGLFVGTHVDFQSTYHSTAQPVDCPFGPLESIADQPASFNPCAGRYQIKVLLAPNARRWVLVFIAGSVQCQDLLRRIRNADTLHIVTRITTCFLSPFFSSSIS